jgi:hypothetical protein
MISFEEQLWMLSVIVVGVVYAILTNVFKEKK